MDDKRDKGSFEQRLNEARGRQGLLDPGETGAQAGPGADTPPESAAGMGARIGVELAAALVVGGAIGYWLDRWLHTSPWFLLLFFVAGSAAGMLNVWRLISPREPPVKKPD